MTVQYAIVGLVLLQRLLELLYARRNTNALRRIGAAEYGARHYALFVVLHASWLIALVLWPMRGLNLPLLAIFVLLQILRLWVIWSLGGRWTTRVLVVPGRPLVRHGPYRFVKHPNYLIVIGEIAVLPLAFGLWELAILFSLLNAVLLVHRVRTEDQALRDARASVSGMG